MTAKKEHIKVVKKSKSDDDSSTKVTPKQILKWGIWAVVVVGIGWLISYSVEQYNAENAEEGVFLCNENECFKTIHIHSDVTFDLCGESHVLTRETGPLDGLHTHKEKNYLHFHERVDLDPATKEAQYEQSLSLEEIMKVFELDPSDYCEGPADVRVLVNGSEPDEGLQYNRKDGDDIEVVFKERS